MTATEPDMFDTSSKLKVKPFCKPDVHLKKSRQRVFSENSIELMYPLFYYSLLFVIKIFPHKFLLI